jgi:hypothetical protein
MTYANRGPQHSGQSYSSFGASHSKLSPEEQQKAQLEQKKLEQQNKLEKARHQKYAVDREKGIFHPGDPQTKTRHVSQDACDAGAGKMPPAEMERRLKAGLMPPEIVGLAATVEQLKDPANKLPPFESKALKGQPTPQAEQTKGPITPQAETPKVAQAPKEMHASAGHTAQTETPVQQFQHRLTDGAVKRLERNKARLTQVQPSEQAVGDATHACATGCRA